MKKHLIAFGTLFLFAAAGLVAAAQDASDADAVAARLAARRAAEENGGVAVPAAPAETSAAIGAAASATNSATNSAGASATNSAELTPEQQTAQDLAAEEKRKANLLAAQKALPASNNNLAALQLIWKRNIFDPQRQPYVQGRVASPNPVIETFSLRGTSDVITKGWVAFFAGDGIGSYPATRSIDDLVLRAIQDQGYHLVKRDVDRHQIYPRAVAAATNSATNSLIAGAAKGATNSATNLVAASAAKSALTGPEIVLGLLQGLTRTDGGPWKAYTFTPVYTAPVPRVPADISTFGQMPMFASTMPTISVDPITGAFSVSSMDANDPFAPTVGRRGRRGGGGGGGGGRGGRGGGGGGAGGGGFGGGGFGGGAGGGGFGGGAAGGGFGGGAAGGGFGGGGAANVTFAPAATAAAAAPTAAPDPAVLARLQAQRNAEGQ